MYKRGLTTSTTE